MNRLRALLVLVLIVSGCASLPKITSATLQIQVAQQEGAAAAWQAVAAGVCEGAASQGPPRITTTALAGVQDSQQTSVSGTVVCSAGQ